MSDYYSIDDDFEIPFADLGRPAGAHRAARARLGTPLGAPSSGGGIRLPQVIRTKGEFAEERAWMDAIVVRADALRRGSR